MQLETNKKICAPHTHTNPAKVCYPPLFVLPQAIVLFDAISTNHITSINSNTPAHNYSVFFSCFRNFFNDEKVPQIEATDALSVGTLFRKYWGKISVTWGLTLCETAMMALLPLLIGRSIDGLLMQDYASFGVLLCAMVGVVACIVARRAYDTRAYGTMRVEIGKALVLRSSDASVSIRNARVLMSRELVDFLEFQAPHAVTSIIRVVVSIAILFSFNITLAVSAGFAIAGILIIYSLAAHYFFAFNGRLNAQTEMQVEALERDDMLEVSTHFQNLRSHEVKISDLESLVYGLIFSSLFCMLAFNLWFAASKSTSSPGQIFSVVMYSYQFVNSAMSFPYTFQALTRLKEITARINNSSQPSPCS